MKIAYATPADVEAWLSLAREVEPLFGPMADEASFRDALQQAISEAGAIGLRAMDSTDPCRLAGGIVILREANSIEWLAVAEHDRGRGYGTALLGFALSVLDRQAPISVQTFDASVPEGRAARKLYGRFGFDDQAPGGLNPASLPTVIMRLRTNSRGRAAGADAR